MPFYLQDFEKLREQQVSDDTIAQQLSASNPKAKAHIDNLRQATNNDPRAITSYLNMRYYGDAQYKPGPSAEPKGFFGRTIDRLRDNLKKDAADIGQSVEDFALGKQGFLNTVGQVGGNIASVAASPISQPLQEGIGTAAKGVASLPGVSNAVSAIGQSDIAQGIGRGIGNVANSITEASKDSPTLRTALAVGEGAFDALDVAGAGALGKAALRSGAGSAAKGAVSAAGRGVANTTKGTVSAALHPIKTATQTIPNAAGKATGAAGRAVATPFKSFLNGVKGTTDDIAESSAKRAATFVDNRPGLKGVAKESVDKGIDERLVRQIAGSNADEKLLMRSIAKEAYDGTLIQGGSTKHREIAGKLFTDRAEQIVKTRKEYGKALGGLVRAQGDEVIDASDAFESLVRSMQDRGVSINSKGRITKYATGADQEIPLLQQMLDALKPDANGNTVLTLKDADFLRKKLFANIDGAKANLNPTQGGQNIFGFSEQLANNVRSSLLKNISDNINPNYRAYAQAYAESTKAVGSYLRFLGYKGSLDDISSEALGAAEKAFRSLGNAASRPKGVLEDLIEAAKKAGFESNVDAEKIIKFVDATEDIFPQSVGSRSLKGQVNKANNSNLAINAGRFGPKNTVQNLVGEKVAEAIEWARGMTAENRLRLLDELFDTTPEGSFIEAVEEVLPNQVKNLVEEVGEEAAELTVRDGRELVGATVSKEAVENIAKESNEGIDIQNFRTGLLDVEPIAPSRSSSPQQAPVATDVVESNLSTGLLDVEVPTTDIDRFIQDMKARGATDEQIEQFLDNLPN
jgi:hypothetical protein